MNPREVLNTKANKVLGSGEIRRYGARWWRTSKTIKYSYFNAL